MFAYPCGTTYSVTLVTAHAQCILVNHKVKGCLYMSHEMYSDVCGTSYCVTLVTFSIIPADFLQIIKKDE